MRYHLYTDGACQPNPGIGGWAFILKCSEKNIDVSKNGSEPKSTNNRMELQAIIEGLKYFREISETGDTLNLYSDSKYLLHGTKQWVNGWIKKGWIKSDKKPVKNKDLWEQIYYLKQDLEIQYQHIPGHSGHIENEAADKLAVEAISQIKKGIMNDEQT